MQGRTEMTLLNQNLFSRENFATLAKSISQSGNNSQRISTTYSGHNSSPRINRSTDRDHYKFIDVASKKSGFEKEVETAASDNKSKQNSSIKEIAADRTSANQLDINERHITDATDRVQVIKKLLSDKGVEDGGQAQDIKGMLAKILSPEEMKLLSDLGFGSKEAIIALLFNSQTEINGKEITNSQKALSFISKAKPELAQKLSELSGIPLEQIDSLLGSLVITKQVALKELHALTADPVIDPDKHSAVDLLSLLSGKNSLTGNQKNKSNASTYLVDVSEIDKSGENDKLFANISHVLLGSEQSKSAIDKIISDFGDNSNGLSLSGKNTPAKYAKTAINLPKTSIIRNITLDNIASTTAKLVTQTNAGDTTTARMHLNPRSLGTVFVEIHLNGEMANIKFRTESADTARVIEAQISQLKEQLQKEGITTSKIEYTQDGHNSLAGDTRQQNSREEMESRKEFIQDKHSVSFTRPKASFGELIGQYGNSDNIQNLKGRLS